MRYTPKGLAKTAAGLALAGGSLFISAVPASATSCSSYGPTQCTTTTTAVQAKAQHTPDAGASHAVPATGGLAFTGADVAITATAGAAAVAAGGMLVLVSRRRRSEA
ncbi:MAG TPA: hypothetical protein VKI19_06145 [Acidimicrobiales bacterium]|nr:hypothetical protein [Acidimicrobiales bacterium]